MRHTYIPASTRIKGKYTACSVKVYGTPCSRKHYMLERKEGKFLLLKQNNNAKVTFHTIMSSWVMSDLSTPYFKLMTFRL